MEFGKNFSTYDENAIIQKKVAENLTNFISKKFNNQKFDKVIELGCGTGIFTREFLKKFEINEIDLNDCFNTRDYFKEINYKNFICDDMNEAIIKNYDIVISSSSFQWIEDLEKLIESISKKSEKLAFSIYIDGNLKEIAEHFGVGLKYKKIEDILIILKKYFKNTEYYSEEKTLKFSSPIEALRHLKKTGVTIKNRTSIYDIKSYKNTLLTYNMAYFISYN